MSKEAHSHNWWIPYVEEYKNGDMTLRRYAESKGLGAKALEYHVTVERKKRKAQQSVEIIPVTIAASSDALDVSINGINVTADPDTIRTILGVKL